MFQPPLVLDSNEGDAAKNFPISLCVYSADSDMTPLYRLRYRAFRDAGWIGEAGPGPSYLDPGSGGPENEFTQRNTTFMTWNLMHLAATFTVNGGFPVGGNQRTEWDAGARFDYENPEYR